MNKAETATAYGLGLDAGHLYFQDGVQRSKWNWPEDGSPFDKDSDEDESWWNGFYDAISDAEAVYYS